MRLIRSRFVITPLFILILTHALYPVDLFSRPPGAESFVCFDATIPTGVAGTAGGAGLLATLEQEGVPLAWSGGLVVFGASTSSGLGILGLGVEIGVESNFKKPVEPVLGIATDFSVLSDANDDHSFGIKPYFGFRISLLDDFCVSLLCGNLICHGGNSKTEGYRSSETGSGVVLGVRLGYRASGAVY